MGFLRRLRGPVAMVVVLLPLGFYSGAADGSEYPERTIQLIFPFAAGSPGDVSARKLAKIAERWIDQQIQVVDRPGAAGTIGATQVIASEPNGYTVGFIPIAPMTVQPQRTNLAYEGTDDYRPVIMISKQPSALYVPANSPWQTLDEFLKAARSKNLEIAGTGRGNILDINTRLLAQQADVSLSTVPFDGGKQAIAATLGGTTDAGVTGTTSVLPFARSGKMRVLATFTKEPVEVFPRRVPTVKSHGYDITFGVDNFVIVPEGTPDKIAKTLHDAFKKAMMTRQYQQFLKQNGYVEQYMGPERLAHYLQGQYEAYGTVIKDLGLAQN